MKFSVVIPAYNESQFIERAIRALRTQTIARCDFEIIVVDNNSEDDTGDIARRAGADTVLKEPIRGPNVARQKGVSESKGAMVAFLDADCQPPPDWLELIEEALSDPDVAAISGPYDYGFGGWKDVLATVYTHYFFRYLDRILFFLLFSAP